MQNPNADTEWNDVLRNKGILPAREKELTEEEIVSLVEQTVQTKSQGKEMGDMSLGELDELEDDIDEEEERIFEAYRRQRLEEMKEARLKSRFGDVTEISKADWTRQINQAGEGIWVIVHVYKSSMPLCKLLNQHLHNLAQKFPQTKFLKSVSSVCIPNYPDKNLPTIFIYRDGEMKKQMIGPHEFGGMNLSQDEMEWIFSQAGAVKSDLEECPRKEVKDVMSSAVRDATIDDDSDDGY